MTYRNPSVVPFVILLVVEAGDGEDFADLVDGKFRALHDCECLRHLKRACHRMASIRDQ